MNKREQPHKVKYISVSLTELIVLFFSNIYLAYESFVLNWNGQVVFYTFLAELIIIFIFTLIKMVYAENVGDPYFSELNPGLIKNKKNALSQLVPFIIVFTGLMITLGLFFTWTSVKDEILLNIKEITYFILGVFLSNLIGIFQYFNNKENEKAYISEIFRNYMTSKILPIFISMYFLNYLFSNSNTFILIIIGLKFLFVLWTFGNEQWIKYT